MLQSSVFSRAAYQQAGGLQKRYRLAHDTHLFAIMGIGQPICAVAGCGTVQTADDDAGTRLTAIHSNRTRNYWVENEALWNDILGNVPSLSREGRRTVRRYRAHARWRLARADWQASEFAGAGKQFSLALATSPGVVANIVLHRFKGGR
jgi:hypothetical protein